MPYSWNKPPKTMRTQTIRNARAAAKTAGPASRPPSPGVLRQADVAKSKIVASSARPSASALRNQQEKESLLRAIAEPGVLTESDIRKLRQVMSRLQESGVLKKEDEVRYGQQLRGRGRP